MEMMLEGVRGCFGQKDHCTHMLDDARGAPSSPAIGLQPPHQKGTAFPNGNRVPSWWSGLEAQLENPGVLA